MTLFSLPVRATRYVLRRGKEASHAARGRLILRRYSAHYRDAQRVYRDSGEQTERTIDSISDVGVRVIESSENALGIALPQDYDDLVARVARNAAEAFEHSANCHFFPGLPPGPTPARTADVPAVANGETITLQLLRPLAVDGVQALCAPLVKELERTVFGSFTIVDKVYVYRNPVSHQLPRASWRWHFDNHPREMLKVMVYLTDVTDDTAPFQYLRGRSSGAPRPGAPLTPMFGTSRVPDEQIERYLAGNWTAHSVTGRRGTIVVFDDNVIHRATLSKAAHRDVVVFQVRPAAFKAAQHINARWTGTFGHRAFNPDPRELAVVPSSTPMPTARDRVKRALKASGLDRGVSLAKNLVRFAIHPQFRRLELESWSEFREWRRNYGSTLRPPLYPAGSARRALIVTKGTIKGTQIELGLIKGLELGGFAPVVLTDRMLEKHYRLAGVTSFARWEQFAEHDPLTVAQAIVAKAQSVDDLLDFEHAGARVGKFALSTTFRSLRVGRLDFSLAETRRMLAAHLAAGMARADAATRILEQLQPDITLFMGNRYTGQGELMDVCVERGIDVLTWFDAHRSSSLMLKRYRMENRDRHHGSISDESWSLLRRMPWGQAQRDALRRELHDNYAAGDWYSRGGTQVNKSIVGTDAIRSRLGLDPAKKTAVIFPHIVWDATLFWGADLFSNYEDWLVETVRAACGNPRVNWIIKIHPAHVAKNAMERYRGEAAELVAIRNRVGELPTHVKVIPPDTDINTFSLFGLMDYCLTVRGTVGIEAACMKLRVDHLPNGTARVRGKVWPTSDPEPAAWTVEKIDTIPHKMGSPGLYGDGISDVYFDNFKVYKNQ